MEGQQRDEYPGHNQGRQQPSPFGIVQKEFSQFTVEKPTKFDVILGRGKSFHRHPGNKRLLRIVDSLVSKFINSSRSLKTSMIDGIVENIKADGPEKGRFLKFNKTHQYWEEVDRDTSHIKVSQAIRYRIRVRKAEALEYNRRRQQNYDDERKLDSEEQSEKLFLKDGFKYTKKDASSDPARTRNDSNATINKPRGPAKFDNRKDFVNVQPTQGSKCSQRQLVTGSPGSGTYDVPKSSKQQQGTIDGCGWNNITGQTNAEPYETHEKDARKSPGDSSNYFIGEMGPQKHLHHQLLPTTSRRHKPPPADVSAILPPHLHSHQRSFLVTTEGELIETIPISAGAIPYLLPYLNSTKIEQLRRPNY